MRSGASANVEPVAASLRFATMRSEPAELFRVTPGTNVNVRIDIEADDPRGFTEGAGRAAESVARALGCVISESEQAVQAPATSPESSRQPVDPRVGAGFNPVRISPHVSDRQPDRGRAFLE